jgi:hypothetical protein
MRLLVCGGRDFYDYDSVRIVLDEYLAAHPELHIAQGGARGADSLAAEWAVNRGVRVSTFLADWQTHGRSAGMKRNARMLRSFQPDAVLAFPGGKGTVHMCSVAAKAGVPVRYALVPKYKHKEVRIGFTTDDAAMVAVAREADSYYKP